MIVTDAKGRPFVKPDPPPPGASPEDRQAYLRAYWAWKDACTDAANKVFIEAFRKTVKRKP